MTKKKKPGAGTRPPWPDPPAVMAKSLSESRYGSGDKYVFTLGDLVDKGHWAYYQPYHLPVLKPFKNLDGTTKCYPCNWRTGSRKAVAATWIHSATPYCDACAEEQRQQQHHTEALVALRQAGRVLWLRLSDPSKLELAVGKATRQWLFETPAGTETQVPDWMEVKFQDLRHDAARLDPHHVARAILRGYLELQKVHVAGGKRVMHVRRTEKSITPAQKSRNTSALPWSTGEHHRVAATLPVAVYLTWRQQLGQEPPGPGIYGAVNLVRKLSGWLQGTHKLTPRQRWELEPYLMTQQSLELVCALAAVEPLYEDGKLRGFTQADPQRALEVAQRIYDWPGASTNLYDD